MLEELNQEYDQLQLKYGAKELHSIYNGGCTKKPNLCLIFMNPTGRNIASAKDWKGIHSPWIGTKNIWAVLYQVGLLDEDIYLAIKNKKGSDWTPLFARQVYANIRKHKVFITNLGKCTQVDARPLPNEVYRQYLDLLLKEIAIIRPKKIITFGNQVSSIILNEKIAVSQCRKKGFTLIVDNQEYPVYPVYYPVGNGSFNIDKALEDLKWIINQMEAK